MAEEDITVHEAKHELKDIEKIVIKKEPKLSGKKVLVTGASRGIGRAIAIAVVEEGADVVINYRTKEKEAIEVANMIESVGMNVWICQADISKIEEVKKMKDCVEKYFGKIDILVNNAGINVDKLFIKMTEEDWNKVISVNLSGVFNCTKLFIEHILESQYGRIINISSIVGEMGNIGQVNYASAKSGLIGFTKALAKELAGKGISVNAIAPGFIETDMLVNVPDKIKEKILNNIPMKRFGKPEEIAKGVVFLASPDASYITGHVLDINGGMYV